MNNAKMKAAVEQKINMLKRELSVDQINQLSKLIQEFNAFVIITNNIEASDISDILRRASSRVDPIILYLFQAMLLAQTENYQKASELLSASSGSSRTKTTIDRQ